MDYIEAFKNLKTNNKYSRKSPHKAILLLTVIELYETNVLSDNIIYYDEILKNTFQKVWERTLREEPLFHAEVYFPFWYMQTEDFWHIVPIRGKEDVLSLMRDTNVKPSESKLIDCVRYAELDEDLYFLMTLPSGRSSLKRVLLETYTNLSGSQIDKLSKSEYNAVDYSLEALSDYEKILSLSKNEYEKEVVKADSKLVDHFNKLSEDLQIVINLQYFSFLKSNRNERGLFKELFPTVYDLYNYIVNRPIKRGYISPTFAIIYDNFLSDLRISLMGEDGSMELINKIEDSLDFLRGEIDNEKIVDTAEKNDISQQPVKDVISRKAPEVHIPSSYDELEIEDVYEDSHGKITNSSSSAPKTSSDEISVTESRKGKTWTAEEEMIIKQLFEQGKDFSTIAAFVARTEVAIKSRLAKLGLIDYTYGQDNDVPTQTIPGAGSQIDESDFSIENSFDKASILDKNGKRVFVTDGKLKYLRNKLYRLNIKPECFTLKGMFFNGSIWIKGTKKIVAYPQSDLFRMVIGSYDYSKEVEDIVDSPVFEDCKLKVGGAWYSYDGYSITNSSMKAIETDNRTKLSRDTSEIKKSPLYAVRRQAILKAMSFFRVPASKRDIARTISRTAWGSVIKEDDVELILTTMSEIISIRGKYILRN